jgi:hypothetical protein
VLVLGLTVLVPFMTRSAVGKAASGSG